MLRKHSFINGDGRRRCEKANIPCRYPDAPNSDECELAQETTEQKARRAGQVIKRFCISQKKKTGCEDCPIYDICSHLKQKEVKDGELNGM